MSYYYQGASEDSDQGRILRKPCPQGLEMQKVPPPLRVQEDRLRKTKWRLNQGVNKGLLLPGPTPAPRYQ